MSNKPLICSICFQDIKPKSGWYMGNSAMPVNEGRCCDECDVRIVLPARVNLSQLSKVQPKRGK